ncbi:DUF1622 domain-containing protein [bacterium]|nr:MAG: DUF1622 domain-containing protein [bacterium]
MNNLEHLVQEPVRALRLTIEMLGAVTILLGAIAAIRAGFGSAEGRLETIRLVFARYLVLALEFQLGADILSTAIAPTWDQIGKLGAIAIIRTALNFFLTKELRDEAQRQAGQTAGGPLLQEAGQ